MRHSVALGGDVWELLCELWSLIELCCSASSAALCEVPMALLLFASRRLAVQPLSKQVGPSVTFARSQREPESPFDSGSRSQMVLSQEVSTLRMSSKSVVWFHIMAFGKQGGYVLWVWPFWCDVWKYVMIRRSQHDVSQRSHEQIIRFMWRPPPLAGCGARRREGPHDWPMPVFVE